MVKAMPPHIKKCFLYRKVFRDVFIRKKNAGFVITGATGSGKSLLALKLASDLDPTFSAERIVFNTEDFLKLLVEGDSNGLLSPGKAVIFDETSHEEAMDSRSSLSSGNKQMAALSTIYRAMRLIVFYVAPNLSQIDSRVRAVSITGLFQMRGINYVKKTSKADFYWSTQNSRTGVVYYKRPRLVNSAKRKIVAGCLEFGKAPQGLIDEYESNKTQFIKRKLEKWYGETRKANEVKIAKAQPKTVVDITAEVFNNKDLFLVGGRISPIKIMERFNIGLSKASRIAAVVRNAK